MSKNSFVLAMAILPGEIVPNPRHRLPGAVAECMVMNRTPGGAYRKCHIALNEIPGDRATIIAKVNQHINKLFDEIEAIELSRVEQEK